MNLCGGVRAVGGFVLAQVGFDVGDGVVVPSLLVEAVAVLDLLGGEFLAVDGGVDFEEGDLVVGCPAEVAGLDKAGVDDGTDLEYQEGDGAGDFQSMCVLHALGRRYSAGWVVCQHCLRGLSSTSGPWLERFGE